MKPEFVIFTPWGQRIKRKSVEHFEFHSDGCFELHFNADKNRHVVLISRTYTFINDFFGDTVLVLADGMVQSPAAESSLREAAGTSLYPHPVFDDDQPELDIVVHDS